MVTLGYMTPYSGCLRLISYQEGPGATGIVGGSRAADGRASVYLTMCFPSFTFPQVRGSNSHRHNARIATRAISPHALVATGCCWLLYQTHQSLYLQQCCTDCIAPSTVATFSKRGTNAGTHLGCSAIFFPLGDSSFDKGCSAHYKRSSKCTNTWWQRYSTSRNWAPMLH